MILKDKDSTRLLLKCTCGCSGLEFMKFDWNYSEYLPAREYYIYHTVTSFDAQQVGFFNDLKRRFKMAFNILWKGTYRYNEICLSATDFKELQDIIIEFSEDSKHGEVL
jgi:hypothetical protein